MGAIGGDVGERAHPPIHSTDKDVFFFIPVCVL